MIAIVKTDTDRDTQPHKYILYLKFGPPTHGEAETKQLCIDRIKQLLDEDQLAERHNHITCAYYLGFKGKGTPKRVTL